jgi:hypothetical protein
MARAIGTTIGTPRIGMMLVDRFRVSRKITSPPPIAHAATRAHSRLIGRTATPLATAATGRRGR